MRTIQFRVSGKVQGVGFRYSTKKTALSLGISGWVRNRKEGDVEGVAQGLQEKIEIFQTWLWKGPDYARVNKVVITEIQEKAMLEFEIC